MRNARPTWYTVGALACLLVIASGCGDASSQNAAGQTAVPTTPPASEAPNSGANGTNPQASGGDAGTKPAQPAAPAPGTDSTNTKPDPKGASGSSTAPGASKGEAVQVVAKPAEIAVLVNKTSKLPEDYKPQDLVDPNVPFTFKEKLEKRKMRKEAAAALEKLFQAAKDAGLPLAGVSAYRSHETQTALYNNYVKQEGEEKANKYSAKPGHSEHETGLAIDVAGCNGKCPAQDCFGATQEAKWLAEHAHEYGFIIRYPKGKEAITGYQYEPWHLRYVGVDLAKDIVKQGLTLEEYTAKGVPVNKAK
ncbi:M15 family metallopeptidase [Paenibacillus validus]|uniref:M15 family metallopeptidase n=1 Tax=Paenibacillus validus TaxID=44253 RepID=UPI003D2714E7